MTEVIPTEDLTVDEAVLELAAVEAELEALKSRQADLKKIIAHEREAGKYVTSDGVEFRVTIPKNFQKAAFAKDYPRDHDEANKQLYKTKHEVDLAAVRAVFTEEELEGYYKDGGSQVKV